MSKHLIDAVAINLGVSKAKAAKAVKAVTSSIEAITAKRGSLTIINFGSFSVRPFKRTSVLKGKTYDINKNIVRFKPGAGFSQSVN